MMIESWLITASAPFCGTDTHYCAFSDGNPVDKPEFDEIYCRLVSDMWDSYSYLLHLEDEEYESEEELEEIYEQAWADWEEDCSIVAEPMSLKELQGYIPGGPLSETDLPEIVYDER
jgi:hypothetical protein